MVVGLWSTDGGGAARRTGPRYGLTRCAEQTADQADDTKTGCARAETHGCAGRDDLPVAARHRREDEARVLRRVDRPRSEGRHPRQAAAAPWTGRVEIQSSQPPHLL